MQKVEGSNPFSRFSLIWFGSFHIPGVSRVGVELDRALFAS
jgi:hypothetical protein